MPDVFISYSRKDIAFARLIREALQQGQLDPWIDWDRIPVGERWWEEICQAIATSNVFMFIISRTSIGSKVCREEIDQALQNHKRIIPIIVDDLPPEAIQAFAPELPKLNWVIFERDHIFRVEECPEVQSDKPEDRQVALPALPQFEEALTRLSKAIHTDWDWVKYHTQLQVDALRWESNRRDPSYLIRGAELAEAEQQLFRAAGKDPQPTALQVEYVTASRQEETLRQQEKLRLEQKARQRQRMALWAVGVGLALAVVLGTTAWSQRNQYLDETHVRATAQADAIREANARATAQVQAEIASTQAVEQRDQAEQQAKIALANGLAAQARNYLENEYDLALLLSAEALNTWDTYQSRDSLLTAVEYRPRLVTYLRAQDKILYMAFSPDGKTIAGVYCAQLDAKRNCAVLHLQFWDVGQRQPVGDVIAGLTGPLVYAPDGQALIARRPGASGALVQVDVQTRQVTEIPYAYSGYPIALIASADGSLLASISCPPNPDPEKWSTCDQLSVWKRVDGELLYQTNLLRTSNLTDILAFRPDGKALSWGGCAGEGDDYTCTQGAVNTWDAVTGEVETHSAANDSVVLSVAYSPDGKTLAAGDRAGLIHFFDPVTWQEAGRTIDSGYKTGVEKVHYLNDGMRLVDSGFGDPVQLWDLATGKLIDTFSPKSDFFSYDGLALSPQGDLLASSGCNRYDNTGFLCQEGVMLLWDITTRPPLGQVFAPLDHFAFHDKRLLSPDGRFLAHSECVKTEDPSNSNTRCIGADLTVVEVATGKQVGPTIENFPSSITAAAFLPSGESLVTISCPQNEEGKMTCARSRIDWWDAASGKLLRPSIFYDKWILNLTVSPDGKYAFFNGNDNTIERWDLETGKLAEPALQAFLLNEMAFSPDGKVMAASGCTEFFQSCTKSEVRFWDTETWTLLDSTISLAADHFDVSHIEIADLDFSPDGTRLAISIPSGIRFWDFSTHQFVKDEIPEGGGSALAFSRDGAILAFDGLQLWDLGMMLPVGKPLPVDQSNLGQFVFSLDDAQLITDAGVLWDVDPTAWQALACRMANRNLTADEWKIYAGDAPYRKTCPGVP